MASGVMIWIVPGVVGLLASSLLIGIAIARILGTIGAEVAELLEADPWTSARLTRETEPVSP
jgi:hypothetical protein